jgi:hypothetical protein
MQPHSGAKHTVHHDGLNSQSLTSELPKNAIHIRSSFLWRNTLVDSIKLVQTAPLHDLQAWCAGASLTPSGNRQHKDSFIVPLVDRFWQTFLLYHEMDLDVLHICAAAVSSRAVTRDSCIYDLLQSVFPVPCRTNQSGWPLDSSSLTISDSGSTFGVVSHIYGFVMFLSSAFCVRRLIVGVDKEDGRIRARWKYWFRLLGRPQRETDATVSGVSDPLPAPISFLPPLGSLSPPPTIRLLAFHSFWFRFSRGPS